VTQPLRAPFLAEGADGDVGIAERGGDSYVRHKGREFLLALYGALRALKLYPAENAVVQKALAELTQVAEELHRRERELELRVSGEFVFVNSTRLRLDLDNYASFSRVLGAFRECGIGICKMTESPAPRDWTVFLSVLQGGGRGDPEDRHLDVGERLAAAGVTVFEVRPPAGVEDEEFRERSKEAAKRVYAQSVSATKEVIASVRMGQSPNLKKIKRVVQGIVDQILNEETSLVGLTTLRDYDEYTFVHSVNVCIFSVALGRKLGLGRRQLYELGVAALLHDMGKARVPVDVITKPSGLSDEEWQLVRAHPWLGALTLFSMRGQADLPYRAIVVAQEHHMKIDLTGYPRHLRPRALSMYSKIVAVADGFDAATTRRSYQAEPFSPADVLQEMRVNPKRGMDPVIVKAFISMVGHYPVGTVVILDTFELAIVHAPNPVAEAISRPTVRIISDMTGNLLYPGHLVDLMAKDPAGAEYARSIIKIADPERYGIRVADYFV
jgi:HD-GYP domain-containing protein (c-di-GMP phosphodiesterase class II)